MGGHPGYGVPTLWLVLRLFSKCRTITAAHMLYPPLLFWSRSRAGRRDRIVTRCASTTLPAVHETHHIAGLTYCASAMASDHPSLANSTGGLVLWTEPFTLARLLIVRSSLLAHRNLQDIKMALTSETSVVLTRCFVYVLSRC